MNILNRANKHIYEKNKRKGIGIDLPLIVLFLFASTILVLFILWMVGTTKTIAITYEGRQDYIKPLAFVFLYDRSCDVFFHSSPDPQPNVHYLQDYLDDPNPKNREALENCVLYFLEKRVNSDIIINNKNKRVGAYIKEALFEVDKYDRKEKERVAVIPYTKGIYKVTNKGVSKKVGKIISTAIINFVSELRTDMEKAAEDVVNFGVDVKNSIVKGSNALLFGIAKSLHISYSSHVKWSKEKVIYYTHMPFKYKGKVYDVSIAVFDESLNVKSKS